MLRLGAGIAHRPRTEHQLPPLRGITRTTAIMSTSSLLPMTSQYTAEGRRLLGLHGTNGRTVRIGAVNSDGEIVDECDVEAREWFISWTAADGEIVEKTHASHNRACIIAGVLEGTR